MIRGALILFTFCCMFAGCAATTPAPCPVSHSSVPTAVDQPQARAEDVHVEDAAGSLHRIAFGSCCNQEKPQDIWKTIVASEPDLFIFLGDNIYADTEDMAKMKSDYDKLGAVPAFQELRHTCPILATWDDHDYGKNDAGAEYPKKKEAQQLLLDFFEEPGTSPRWSREGVYGAKIFGIGSRRVQVILLDTRYFRSELKRRPKDDQPPADRPGPYLPNTDDSATILGDAQWKWLDEQLRIPAELRIIASSIQVATDEHGYEKWGNMPRERDRLFKMIKDTNADGVIIISGDRHAAEVSKIDDAIGYPLYDVTSSALNMPRNRQVEANRYRVKYETLDEPYFAPNFGLLTIDWSLKDPLISMQIRDANGKIVMRHEVPLSKLRRSP